MQVVSALQVVVDRTVSEFGFEFVGLEISSQPSGQLLRIYADVDGGIKVSQLQELSRHVQAVIAVEFPSMENYGLEVSSPGLDRQLFTLEHYQKYIGKKIKVKFSVLNDGRKKISGILRKVEVGIIQLELDPPEGLVDIEFSTIEKAKLVPEFK